MVGLKKTTERVAEEVVADVSVPCNKAGAQKDDLFTLIAN